MIAFACVLLSAAGFYFSIGLGDQWWLAWLAPVPVLWFCFGPSRPWQGFLVSFLAAALGGCNLLRAYAGSLPAPLLILAVAGPALCFTFAAMGAKRVREKLGPVPAMFAFATLWATVDFLSAFSRSGGAIATPAASQVGAPVLIQILSVTGFVGLTFLLGFVSAGIALSLRMRSVVPIVLAAAVFVANAGFGYVRMSTPPGKSFRVALIESDDAVGKVGRDDQGAALAAIDAYIAEIEKLRGTQVALIVLPENIARLGPAWRSVAEARLSTAAKDVQSALVAGFNTELDGAQHNVSLGFLPGEHNPVIYEKRRLVPVLETKYYTPGPGPKLLSNFIGLEICKDMDFPGMLREDETATRPLLLAVPAWDFDKDDWSHARVAVMRSVENGVPMARTARDGLLTLNDRYGTIVARARAVAGFTTLIGDLRLGGSGGGTIYDRIGDAFGWLCVATSAALLGLSFAQRTGRRGRWT
jgi:apolipoprotein N-acyltransferase